MKTFLLFLLFIFLIPTIYAQKIRVETFSDIAFANNIVVQGGDIWLGTTGGIVRLDTTGKIIKRYNSYKDNFTLQAQLIEGENHQPYIIDRKKFYTWDSLAQKWIDKSPPEDKKYKSDFNSYDAFTPNIFVLQFFRNGYFWKNDKWLYYEAPKIGKNIRAEDADEDKAYPDAILLNNGTVFLKGLNQILVVRDSNQFWQRVDSGYALLFVFDDTLYLKKQKVYSYWDGTKMQATQKWADMPDDININETTRGWNGNINHSKYYPNTFDTPCLLASHSWGGVPYLYKGGKWETLPEISFSDRLINFSYYNPFEKISTATIDAQGNVWLASNQGRIFRQRGREWQVIRYENAQPTHAAGKYYGRHFFSHGDTLWHEGKTGMSYWINNSWHYAPSAIDNHTFINSKTVEDKQGRLFIATIASNKLYQYQQGRWQFVQPLTYKLFELDTTGYWCAFDEQGNFIRSRQDGKQDTLALHTWAKRQVRLFNGELWSIGDSTVDCYRNGQILQIPMPKPKSKKEKLSKNFFVDKNGEIFVEFDNSAVELYKYDQQKKAWKMLRNRWTRSNSLVHKDGFFYFIRGRKLYCYVDGKAVLKIRFGKKMSFTTNIFIDSKRRVWAYFDEPNRVEVYNIDTKKRIDSYKIDLFVERFYEDKQGNIWLSDDNHGIIKMQLEDR